MKAQGFELDRSPLCALIRSFSFIVVFMLAMIWFLVMPTTPLSAPQASMDGPANQPITQPVDYR